MNDTEEVMDLVVELINQMGHTGAVYEVRNWSQTCSPYDKLREHPLFIAAEKRRREKYWANIKRASDAVSKWPEWMRR